MKPYAIFGWVVWQVVKRVAGRKLAQNQVKLGAIGVVAAVLVAGVIAARSASSDE